MAKIINMPPNKTAMSPAKSGLPTRELNTKARSTQVDNEFRHRCEADSFPVGKSKAAGNQHENRNNWGEGLK